MTSAERISAVVEDACGRLRQASAEASTARTILDAVAAATAWESEAAGAFDEFVASLSGSVWEAQLACDDAATDLRTQATMWSGS